jgi:MinD-like ATPase involved in chromosome partitioning or flagellar assembly
MASQFLPRVRGLHVIPFDDHLAEGAEVHLQLLSGPTRQAFLELAATIVAGISAIDDPAPGDLDQPEPR